MRYVKSLLPAALVVALTGASALPAQAMTQPEPAAGSPVQSTAAELRSYIVTLRPTSGTGVAATAENLAQLVGGRIGFVYQHVLTGFSVRMPAEAVPLLRAHPLVATVRPDVAVMADDTETNATWGLDRADQRTLPLDTRYTYPAQAGQGAHIYVIDTGINPDHTEFTGRVGTSRNFVAPLLGSTDPTNWEDCNGHGTHVSSTAAGTVWGVAKKATLHAVRVLDCQGSGSSSAIIAGMDWVASNKQSPAVANMSLGTVSGRAPDIETAARNLVAADVALAVAAGNDNKDACTTSPAAEPSALTTGATTRTDARASFSNYGRCVDLFAPGDSITAANYNSASGSTTMSGTSMASPHVAGALALIRAESPSLSSAQAQSAVVADATSGVVSGAGSGSPDKLLFVSAGSVTPPPADAGPVASFVSGCAGLTCSFDASGSTDDRGIAGYAWTFGDGSSGSGVSPSHAYAAGGSYSVRLTVTDTAGQTATAVSTVTVSAPAGAPCTGCTAYSGTLASGAQAYHPGSAGFTWSGGLLKGYLRGPAGADFDLYLERYSCFLTCGWSSASSGTSTSADENVSYNASSGTYRWRVSSYSGAGSYSFWGQPR